MEKREQPTADSVAKLVLAHAVLAADGEELRRFLVTKRGIRLLSARSNLESEFLSELNDELLKYGFTIAKSNTRTFLVEKVAPIIPVPVMVVSKTHLRMAEAIVDQMKVSA